MESDPYTSQMNRWKVKNYPPRKNLQIQSTAEDYFEFSVVVEHSVSLVDIDFNKTFTNAGVLGGLLCTYPVSILNLSFLKWFIWVEAPYTPLLSVDHYKLYKEEPSRGDPHHW